MKPYDKSDLEKLLLTLATSEKSRKHPERFWIPVICMFSGMRQNEIAQLYINDIVQEDGIWRFNITEYSEDKRVKSKAGHRMVPIHPVLLSLGILDYRRSLGAQNECGPSLKQAEMAMAKLFSVGMVHSIEKR